MLSLEGIVPHSIISREKGPEKLREKIPAKERSYDDLLNGIPDLAGVRIISFFPGDVDKVVPLIEKEFKVDPDPSTIFRSYGAGAEIGQKKAFFKGLAITLSEYRCF
ncbi:MAG: hypothetical protein KJ573_15465 [Proteobacteria bacterium]|nr:hypothetical protein [Pseudomonadota bacterium]MBU1904975.1 hypothetical protein [Pseudomonadota bacterium]